MKIRSGFVSNSSSTSFVVLLPENFDIEKIDFSKYLESIEEAKLTEETVKEAFNEFVKDGAYWHEYGALYVLEEILDSYKIGAIETGPEGGELILADKKRIKEILNEN